MVICPSGVSPPVFSVFSGSIASGILPWLNLKTSAMPSSIADRRVSGAFVRLLYSVVAAGMVVFIASSAGASPLKSCTGLLA